MNLYNARADRIAERQRCYMAMDAKLSSWEELDKSLLADDVRGGLPLLLGGVGISCHRARPSTRNEVILGRRMLPIKSLPLYTQSAKRFSLLRFMRDSLDLLTSADKLNIDAIRNDASLEAFREQAPHSLMSPLSVVKRQIINPHRDESIRQRGIHVPGELHGILKSIFAIIE